MRRQLRWFMFTLGALVPTVPLAPARAQRPQAETMPTGAATSLSASDRRFVAGAGTSNLAELKVAKLALDRGSSQQIKELAQMLIDDHTKAGDQLRQIAQQEAFSLPSEPTSKQKTVYEQLSQLSGSAFDSAFLKQMKTDHQKAVSLFREESTTAQNPQLRNFASQTLPTLEHHQQMVQRQIHQM